ncbi:MFS transporter [Streptomyces thermoviolaceus]|uniref:MFS transporter n=1 Tax=Streptomyces thermoviolaceus subsp. thermoviolaceus TaxID=66860 RepID=A0ABX0YVA2_STRTL|nr:MDR family MFS transporter [Streptomyces thermoviolaceus]MCM3267036.1 MFS transporter [Streptomyces thermoviolaceus]NJP16363.1 MFS transporter [Streptomyces thermoviolaceus subsp. thermoviolaceus]WTD48913.1 MFS transporter [Streptomyces thermoviolaceus]GHB08623.1 MFS transporter [Streptomyces thermoviolaceus subsp. thermoviolaceus]
MTDTARPPAQSETTGGPKPHAKIILIGLMLGMFLSSLDQTVVATAMRTITDDLHGLTQQAWVTTVYLITSVVSTALYGKLSDDHGRRPVYLLAVGIFLAGSVLAGLSQEMWQLIASRAVQGIGAGGLMSLAFTILADVVPMPQRTRYQAWFGAVFGVSAVVGPVVGGWFAGMDTFLGATGWRWAFFINVPIAVAAMAIIGRLLRLPKPQAAGRQTDVLGLATLVVCLVPLLIAAEQGRAWGWGSGSTLALFAVGVVGLVLFLLAQRRAGEAAILPLSLFRNRVFTLVNGANVIVGMGVFGVLTVLPMYLQIVRGLTPTQAGLMLLPQTVGIVLSGRVAGPYVARTGNYKIVIATGVVLMAVASWWLSTTKMDTGLWQTGGATLVMGVGVGFSWQVMLVAIQRNAAPQNMGAAMASYTFFRQIGSTAGASVFLAVFFGTVSGHVARSYADAASDSAFAAAAHDPSVASQPANRILLRGADGSLDLDDTSFLAHADDRIARPLLQAMTQAIDEVYLVSGCFLVLGVLLSLFVPQQRPHQTA